MKPGLNARWLRKDLTHRETQEFTRNVLNHMRERLVKYQEEYGDLYNLEATPAESTAYRLAKHDRKRWPDIITAGKARGYALITRTARTCRWTTAAIFSTLWISRMSCRLCTLPELCSTRSWEKSCQAGNPPRSW